jgi:crotonobetainyl-CoA:carnitine CoA-transferase CaiB-like acyl-CoA transferase
VSGPLQGVRVLDLSRLLPGGFCSLLLADDGADVLKVVQQLGAPVKLSRTPADGNRLPGPELGQHTEAVLRAAGYDGARIEALLSPGAVGGPPQAQREGELLRA